MATKVRTVKWRRRIDLRTPLDVPRCKVCAEHCETFCSRCRRPVCLRHNVAPSNAVELRCSDCALTRFTYQP